MGCESRSMDSSVVKGSYRFWVEAGGGSFDVGCFAGFLGNWKFWVMMLWRWVMAEVMLSWEVEGLPQSLTPCCSEELCCSPGRVSVPQAPFPFAGGCICEEVSCWVSVMARFGVELRDVAPVLFRERSFGLLWGSSSSSSGGSDVRQAISMAAECGGLRPLMLGVVSN